MLLKPPGLQLPARVQPLSLAWVEGRATQADRTRRAPPSAAPPPGPAVMSRALLGVPGKLRVTPAASAGPEPGPPGCCCQATRIMLSSHLTLKMSSGPVPAKYTPQPDPGQDLHPSCASHLWPFGRDASRSWVAHRPASCAARCLCAIISQLGWRSPSQPVQSRHLASLIFYCDALFPL